MKYVPLRTTKTVESATPQFDDGLFNPMTGISSPSREREKEKARKIIKIHGN